MDFFPLQDCFLHQRDDFCKEITHGLLPSTRLLFTPKRRLPSKENNNKQLGTSAHQRELLSKENNINGTSAHQRELLSKENNIKLLGTSAHQRELLSLKYLPLTSKIFITTRIYTYQSSYVNSPIPIPQYLFN